MKRYRIYYRDTDPACPIFSMVVKAYDIDGAYEAFWDTDPNDLDWAVIDVRPV